MTLTYKVKIQNQEELKSLFNLREKLKQELEKVETQINNFEPNFSFEDDCEVLDDVPHLDL